MTKAREVADLATVIPASEITGALPAIDGSQLTSLTSANLTGALPAIDGAAITSLTSANLTGALPAIDGAALTGVVGSTTWGAVGSYGYMFWNNAGTQNPGATVSGGSLYPANGFSHSTTAGYSTATGTQSGTWRLMGETGRYNGSATIYRVDMWSSLFVRIS